MFHYVYVLRSHADYSLYTGYSSDLRERLQEHNLKKNFSTKFAAPWKLIHYEAYLDAEDAKRREKYLKTSQGIRLLKRMLKEYLHKTKLVEKSV